MPTRARYPLKRNAERKFPIRLRVKIPEEGFGLKIDAIHQWLRLELGPGNYAWAGDKQPGQDASAVYLPCVDVAQRLVREFNLELLFIEEMKLI